MCCPESHFQQMDKCITNLMTQAEDLRKLLTICLQDSSDENKVSNQPEEIDEESEIPIKLLLLPIIKKKAKKLICKSANEIGIAETGIKYTISNELINKWVFEERSKIEIAEDADSVNRTPVVSAEKRIKPEENENYISIEEYERINEQLARQTRETYLNHKQQTAQQIAKTHTRPPPPKPPKKYKSSFTSLTQAEKYRIVYDYISLGIGTCERKWGQTRQGIVYYIKAEGGSLLFNTQEEKDNWMRNQCIEIQNRIKILEINTILQKIESSLPAIQDVDPQENITSVRDLCLLSLDRGIGIVATKYSLNLFELEYLLQHTCYQEWMEMVNNDWYSPTDVNIKLWRSKIQIVKLAQNEGYLYASKKARLPDGIIRTYVNLYEKYGMRGLEDYEKVSKPKKKKEIMNHLKKTINNNVENYRYDETLHSLFKS